MDFKRVIKFNTLRAQLSEQELQLADALRDASESDKQLIVESLQPAGTTRSFQKQLRCTHVYASGTVCNGAVRNIVHHNSAHLDFHQFTTVKAKKSARAQSLGDAISTRTRERAVPNEDEEERCSFIRAAHEPPCGLSRDDNIHHKSTFADYHEFDAGQLAAQAADGG